VLAVHRRSYDKGAQIEAAAHVQALIEQKRAARQHRATDRLAQVAPGQPDCARARRWPLLLLNVRMRRLRHKAEP
jgi:hypothetical protein